MVLRNRWWNHDVYLNGKFPSNEKRPSGDRQDCLSPDGLMLYLISGNGGRMPSFSAFAK